jgi:hypothetical protein
MTDGRIDADIYALHLRASSSTRNIKNIQSGTGTPNDID